MVIILKLHAKKSIIRLAVIILLVALTFGGYCIYSYIESTKINPDLKYVNGLERIKAVDCYQDNLKVSLENCDFTKDIKMVYSTGNIKRLVDYANGFYLDVPGNAKFDFSRSRNYTVAQTDKLKVFVTREKSPYENVMEYIDHYNNRFITGEKYHAENFITLHENTTRNIGGKNIRIISLTRDPYEWSTVKDNTYTYAYILTKTHNYYRIMIKSSGYNPKEIDGLLESFTPIMTIGEAMLDLDYHPNIPDNWNDETKKLYKHLQESNSLMWGVYTPKAVTTDGMSDGVATLEGHLNYHFPMVMGYTYLSPNPPIKGMQEAYNDGKIVELTLQISTVDNQGLDGFTPMFKLLDGSYDETLRSFAKKLKEFEHPFLFRLNNEMNTDWTSYSGVVNLCDPEIYIQVWQRIYRIFQEEGVTNAIWIFNPQYGNYPPSLWNDFRNYYPGNDYVQLFGITAYNTGTYYKAEHDEVWSEFDKLYFPMRDLYSKQFGEFPWIITEFGSSSVGGDKAAWITNMFKKLPQIPNIKAAVWFNAADYDFREGRTHIIARPYFLDETPETIKAFKEGLAYHRELFGGE